MNRLQWELTDPACTLSVASACVVDGLAYDKLGNLSESKLRGTYTFNALKPTQVMSATGGSVARGTRTYGYDYLGNQVERPDGSISFNDFNLPARIVDKTGPKDVKAAFLYAANGSRARRETPDETVTYAGPYERHRKAGTNSVEHRLHVPGTGATLRYEGNDAFVNKLPTAFSHGDHLGSTSLVTQNDLEASGGLHTKVLEKRHYEAFGLPVNPNWSAPNPFTDLQAPVLDQGFTGHTEDRAIGVVSMRGRMYDGELGRFITTDPVVDGANPTQAWNRYAYVSNNPLRYTDPSGFFMDHDNGGRGDCQNPDGTPCVAAGLSPEQYQSSGGMFGFIVPLGAALFAGGVALYNWAKDNIHIGGGSNSSSPPSYIPPVPGRDGGGGASGGPPGDGGHGGSGNAPKQPAPSTDGSPGGPQGGGGGEGGNSGVPNYGPGNGQECTSGDDPYIGEDRRFSHTEALGTLVTGLGVMSGVGVLEQLGWNGVKYYAGQTATAVMEASIGVRIVGGGAAAGAAKSTATLLEEESGAGPTPLVYAKGTESLAVDGRNFSLPFEVPNSPYETMAIGENIAVSTFTNEQIVFKLPPQSMAVGAHGYLGALTDDTPTVGTFLSAASELASDSGIPFVRGFCMVCSAGRGPLPALQAAVTGLPTYSGINRVGSFGSGFHRLHLPVLNNLNRANSLMCGR
jgi:RHS repeat-associated protein